MADQPQGGLPVGDSTDPFAPSAPPVGTPAGSATPPQSGAPGAGPPEPRFVPEAQYLTLKAEVDKLKPLSWISEALAVPEVAERVRQAIFVGAPPSVNAPAAPTISPADALKAQQAAIEAKYEPAVRAAVQAGDFVAVSRLSAQMGAELGRAEVLPELQHAAAPLITMTAQGAIENFIASKRLAQPDLTRAIEPRLRAFIAQTSPGALTQLAQSGGLNAALETAYKTCGWDIYQEGYTKAVASGSIRPQPQVVPPYTSGTAGGPLPGADVQTDDDKDDDAFKKWAAEKGITIQLGPKGALIGELH